MRRKITQLREALDCSFFTGDHAFVLQMMLDNIDHYTAQIGVLDERIAVLCEPYERQVAQIDGIPGFGVRTAQDLIGEIGVDMAAFPAAGHPGAPGPGSPPRPGSPPAAEGERTPPAAATPTSAAPSARPPPEPGAPRPFSAPSTGACAPACRRRRPRAPS